MKDSEKSLAAKSNQVLQLIERNELVDAHLTNVQTSLEKKEQMLSNTKAEFDILKGQLTTLPVADTKKSFDVNVYINDCKQKH
ncbi:hypothetical protein [Francisella salimarina]|uniref:hypothetical protein n=1 Tax=Francisella salimarina TaxID=2599927 RepID=UPI003751A859